MYTVTFHTYDNHQINITQNWVLGSEKDKTFPRIQKIFDDNINTFLDFNFESENRAIAINLTQIKYITCVNNEMPTEEKDLKTKISFRFRDCVTYCSISIKDKKNDTLNLLKEAKINDLIKCMNKNGSLVFRREDIVEVQFEKLQEN